MPLIEKRYAEALINIALEQNSLEQYQKDLEDASGIYENHADLSEFLSNPRNDIRTKKEALDNIFKGIVGEDVLNFLNLLVDKARIKFLPGICREFVSLSDEKRNIINMKIVTSVPLDSQQIEKIKEKFRKLYNASSVKTITEVDKNIIGGIRIIIGDKLIDGSIKGKLGELRNILIKK